MPDLSPEETIAHVEKGFFLAARFRENDNPKAISDLFMELMPAEMNQQHSILDGGWNEMLISGSRSCLNTEYRSKVFTVPITSGVKVLLSAICCNPGDITLYLTYAVYHAARNGRRTLDLDSIANDSFPWGFWYEGQKSMLWEGQKLPDGTNGLDSPIVLDWLNTGAEISAT